MWHCWASTELINTQRRDSEVRDRDYTYLCPCTIFPDSCISCMACSRHFTSSVGQRTRVAKAEAKEPAAAFCRSLQERNCTGYLGTGLQHSRATAPAISFLNLYHKHYQTKDSPRGKALKRKGSSLDQGDEGQTHTHLELEIVQTQMTPLNKTAVWSVLTRSITNGDFSCDLTHLANTPTAEINPTTFHLTAASWNWSSDVKQASCHSDVAVKELSDWRKSITVCRAATE